MKYFKKRKLRQFISILLVAALTSVSISGCTYPTKTDGFAKGSKKENESTAINYEVSKLRNVDEIKLAKTETDAGKISEHLQDGYQKLKNAIENLDDPTDRNIIRLKYIDGHTWERICVILNYSWNGIHKKHRKILEKIR